MGLSAVIPGMRRKQSDCIQAYVQALLKGTKTFVSLPRAWWPQHWHSYNDPVCELIYALYGHPRAGDMWGHKLHCVLTDMQFQHIDGWPSVYFKVFLAADGHTVVDIVIFVVYVDDLLLFGGKELDNVLHELAKDIDFEDVQDINKYLGVHHKFHSSPGILMVQWDMKDYLISAWMRFQAETGVQIVAASTPYAVRSRTNSSSPTSRRQGSTRPKQRHIS